MSRVKILRKIDKQWQKLEKGKQNNTKKKKKKKKKQKQESILIKWLIVMQSIFALLNN